MNYNQSSFLKMVSVSVSVLLATNVVAGDGKKKRGHRGPPPVAIEACVNIAVDQACEFIGRHGENVSGICFALPDSESETIACKPNGGPPQERQEHSKAESID